jgi:hypothetical protein
VCKKGASEWKFYCSWMDGGQESRVLDLGPCDDLRKVGIVFELKGGVCLFCEYQPNS